jgi:CRISPR-associated protein Csb2
MFCIEVELLAGRYAASAYNDRTHAEWPPHPARFFSALVSALHDNEPTDEQERVALLWLEQQSAPAMVVDTISVNEQLGRRQVREVFVPVNDICVAAALEPKLRAAEDALEQARAALDAKQSDQAAKAKPRELSKLQKELDNAQQKLAKLEASLRETSSTSDSELKAAKAILPEHRTRQVRTFPVVFPADPCFRFVWSSEPAQSTRTAIDRLCDRVTRLGHSSSLVRCAVVDKTLVPHLVPDPHGEFVLRTVGPGQVERLEREYVRHQAVSSRVLPARPQRYGLAAELEEQRAYPRSVFSDDWIIFERVDEVEASTRLKSSRPLSSRGIDFAGALRRALFEVHGARELPPALSGHTATGERAQTPHVAFVALPHVNHEYADASIKGIAIVLPCTLSEDERRTLHQLVADLERTRAVDADRTVLELATGSSARFFVRRAEFPESRALNPKTWCKPSTRFVTATPILLDRYPGNLRSNVDRTAHKAAGEARASIAAACEHIGLPLPASIEIAFAPLLAGAQPARDFAPARRPGQPSRARVHAEIRFAERICGPVILGAGRYFGLGLCLPVRE